MAKKLDDYEDFYQRTFTEADVNEILKAGGGVNYQEFKSSSKSVINKDYWKVMDKKKKLGQTVFDRYFDLGKLARLNKRGRKIVQKGKTIIHKGRKYKGGQFLPKEFR